MSARRWRAKIERRFAENEKWLKDLQDFNDEAHQEVKRAHRGIELVVGVILKLHPDAKMVLVDPDEGEEE